jgi:GT2 family glycosyltransferase
VNARLTIIILSYNTSELTLRAVESCLALREKDILVHVVDNDSSDGSKQALQSLAKKEDRVTITLLDKNIGFSAGNNVALKDVTTPFVMLLNSDAYFQPGTSIASFFTIMNDNTQIGVITPKVELSPGVLDPASHRGFPTPWNALCYYMGLEKVLGKSIPLFGGYHQVWKDTNSFHEIDACSGAAMFIRTTAMQEVGLLDEQFFMYGEDLDWCYRFKEMKWSIVYDPSCIVFHDKHTSGLKKTKHVGETPHAKEIKQHSKAAFYDAMKLFYTKHYQHTYPGFMTTLTFLCIDFIAHIKHR